ncbi:hypothetical protein PILCRDRAFT_8344 [Piloderma croceum F 1598]|uniref:Uncharacterized protein n=1 Tax=Piloderma croceum (strain F 1598) TaxID=765440 RepID=A0A0C3FTG9_PILCF|nr:hypothetical protein PILCRDRAFT_8344 [Piloderma croceum F 1598]
MSIAFGYIKCSGSTALQGSFTPLAEGSMPITLSGVIDPANPDWSAPSAELLYETVPLGTHSFSGTVLRDYVTLTQQDGPAIGGQLKDPISEDLPPMTGTITWTTGDKPDI